MSPTPMWHCIIPLCVCLFILWFVVVLPITGIVVLPLYFYFVFSDYVFLVYPLIVIFFPDVA